MVRTNVPRSIRTIRRSRGWRQSDLAARCGLSREAVSRLERGGLRGVTLGSLERVVEALGATLNLVVRWDGAELDRLADAAHARLQDQVAGGLTGLGWLTRVEVSFNHFGDRGRVDVVAFHTATRSLLVVEVKTAFGDLQETLGRLDVKARLGSAIAVQLGWGKVGSVVPGLAISDSRRSRRVVAQHAALFGRFAIRGRHAVAWMRRPTPDVAGGLLWFVNLPDSHETPVRRTSRVRTVHAGR